MGNAFSILRRTAVDWYDSMITLALLNVVWLLACLTIILIPPATAAMYAVANDIVHGESSGFSEFLQAGRRYFFKSWLWALINIGVLVVIWANIVFYGQQGTDLAFIVQTFFIFLAVYWLIVQFYFWPFLLEQTNKRVLLALRNSVLTALASPGFTLLMAVFVVALVVLSVVFVLPLGVLTIAVVALLGNHAVRNRLEAFGKIPPRDGADSPESGTAAEDSEPTPETPEQGQESEEQDDAPESD